jgi:CheY-like chemotaxis protein
VRRCVPVLRFAKVLVIAESAVFRRMIGSILRPHAEEVLTTGSARQGRRRIAEHADISLVLSDAVLSDGDGFQLLEYVGSLGGPKPRVILLSASPVEADAQRAENMGAIAYLAKPTSFQEIARVWKQSEGPMQRAARRVRSLGYAVLIDPNHRGGSTPRASHLAWDIRNVSLTGAFLETKAPLPLSTELHLDLAFEQAVGHVKAEVVRVQEPSWEFVAGVGVAFTEFGVDTREQLADYIASVAKRSPQIGAAPPAQDDSAHT